MGLTTPSHKKIFVLETNVRGAIIGGDGDDISQVTGQMTDINQTLQEEMKENSWTWGHLERQAPDRSQWPTLAEALCVPKHEED